LIGSLAAIATVALILFLLMPKHRPGTELLPASVAANATPGDSQPGLSTSLDALIAAAAKAGRRPSEIADLTTAKDKILALAAQKNGGPAGADALNGAARDMAKNEIAILGRGMRRIWRDLGSDIKNASDAAKAVTNLKAAKAELDGRLAADLTALDAAAAIEATRQTLVSFGLFQDAYSAAAPFYVAARRKEFSELYAAVQSSSEQIVALAAVPKPWFLAPQARKQAYQLRQDNAAQAKALIVQLGAIPAATTTDLKQLSAAMVQLLAAQTTLSGLHAASEAAKP
jgi:hypothetical protein